ncbi:hypothetical protein CR513_60147, partial [Mucuna pruriens]
QNEKIIRKFYPEEKGPVTDVNPIGNSPVSPSKCLFDLKFHKGVLTMPWFKVHSSTEIFIRNIVAFEQCHHPSSPYITEYIKILDFLINIGKDVSILEHKKIIVNLLGDDDKVATMFICLNF